MLSPNGTWCPPWRLEPRSRCQRHTTHLEWCLRYLFALAAVAASLTSLQAQAPVADAALHSGTLSFLGRATVGDFVGTTGTVTGAIIGGPDVSTTRGWVEAPVATLVTGNGRRDRDLRATMEVDRYPNIRFVLSGASHVPSTPSDSPESRTLLLHGELSIHGVTRRVELPATVVRAADTTHVTSVFPLDLHDYRIDGLTRMMGLLRMESQIEVRVALRFVDRPVTTERQP
jgi:polyisoprenoid-binding protein YceI